MNHHANRLRRLSALMAVLALLLSAAVLTLPVSADPEVPEVYEDGMLEAAIEEAQALHQSDYEPEGWEALEQAIGAAEAYLFREDVEDEELLAVIRTLKEAIAALVPAVNTDALQALISQAEKIANPDDKYTPNSWQILTDTLESARQLLNGGATQDEINKAVTDLTAAIDGLEEVWYAEQHRLRGDCTNDGRINALDATRILMYMVGRYPLDSVSILPTDVNNDGNISAMDATLVLLHVVGTREITGSVV